jgi:translocator protein
MKRNLTPTRESTSDILRQFSVIFTTLFALIANGAANAIPLNGRNTGEISDSFNVLFVPAGYVFGIWGIIYIGMLAYMVYHSLPNQRTNPRLRSSGWLFALSSLANGAWIFAWHYGFYLITLIIMIILLISLIMAYLNLKIGSEIYTQREMWLISVPVSTYLGWITVATIANATDVLSYFGWQGGGINPQAWTILLLIVGVLLAAAIAFIRHDIPILIVFIWAFSGISVRWLNMPILNAAGFIAAGFVLIILIASRFIPIQISQQKLSS